MASVFTQGPWVWQHARAMTVFHHLELLSNPMRARILRTLASEELGVGELSRVLQVSQSKASRQLKVLHEAGWVEKRSVGPANFYQMRPSALPPGGDAVWALVQNAQPEHVAEDEARLAAVLHARHRDSNGFFGRVGGDWDTLRRELFGQSFQVPALLGLIPAGYTVGDLGCGTGSAAEALAPFVRRVVAVDRERAMLDAARLRLQNLENVDLRKGDLKSLPIDDGELDAALCILVLHHVSEPQAALAEMGRAVSADHGRVVLVDMIEHDRTEYRHTMGHKHLGFGEETLRNLGERAGLVLQRYNQLPPAPEAKGPALFAATLAPR
jgi:ubiquinone/menaquinone biosynthesis C-methylase UbiE/DNA-binding transcriptional ArsR family regulator